VEADLLPLSDVLGPDRDGAASNDARCRSEDVHVTDVDFVLDVPGHESTDFLLAFRIVDRRGIDRGAHHAMDVARHFRWCSA